MPLRAGGSIVVDQTEALVAIDVNSGNFRTEDKIAIARSLDAFGVDYVELGYKADKKVFAPADHGPWKYCDEDCIRRIVGDNDTDLKLAVMSATLDAAPVARFLDAPTVRSEGRLFEVAVEHRALVADQGVDHPFHLGDVLLGNPAQRRHEVEHCFVGLVIRDERGHDIKWSDPV